MRTGIFAGERMCGIPKPVFRSELFFNKLFYYYLMVSNLVLRLAWTYKLSPHLRRNHDTVLAFTLLEVQSQSSDHSPLPRDWAPAVSPSFRDCVPPPTHLSLVYNHTW